MERGRQAHAIGEIDGVIKIVRKRPLGELLGARIVGPHASELIGRLSIGGLLETTVKEPELTVHAHPTLSDSIPEAALAAVGRAIHI